MDFFCGKTVIVDPAFSVRGSLYNILGPATSCKVVFKSYSQKESDIVAVVSAFNVSCSNGHLDILDGSKKLTGSLYLINTSA